jgi:primosomal protein N' (replication factor Y) (superfamily II helicase)
MRALIAQDRDAFYDAEIEARERTHFPPFGRLASLVVSGPDKHETESYARALTRAAPKVQSASGDEVRILGPAEAPLALIRGRHRLRLLAKSPRAFDLSAYLHQWLSAGPKPKGGVKLEIDVDPQSFL